MGGERAKTIAGHADRVYLLSRMSDVPALPVQQQRVRALALASFALGLSIGAAWAISSSRSTPLPLGERVAPADWPIALRLPEGWKYEVNEADRWSGQLTARPREAGGTRLLVLHSRRFGRDPLAAADQFLAEEFRDSNAAIGSLETAAIGPVAGVRMQIEIETAAGALSVHAAAAALPTGESVILALLSTSGSSRMHRTLRSVSESVEFVKPRLARSVGAEAERSGLECPVPAGAWYVSECPAYEPVLAFVADASEEGAWSATAWRTSVVSPRTLEDLVVDQAMTGLLRVDLGARSRTLTIEGRPAAFVEREEHDMLDTTWAVDLGGGAVAMIRAQGPATAGDAIRAACRTLAGGARPAASWADAFDVSAAAKLGGAVVQEVRRRGLQSFWQKPHASAWNAWKYYGDTIGYVREVREVATTTQTGDENGTGFSGTAESEYRLGGRRSRSHMNWTCDAIGEAFRVVSTHKRQAGREQELEVELRRADGGELHISAEGGGQKRSTTVAAGENFMPDPLEGVMLRQFAKLDAGRQMVLQEAALGARRPYAVFWRLEADAEGEARVRRQADFDAGRQVYVLDGSGEIERIVQGEGVELVRTERSKLERSLRWLKSD
jgi:hypothetical protein